MPSVRQIRGRIRSVRSTSRVTRAMQMVAASKMRRAQERVVASRPYAQKLRTVLADLASHIVADESTHPLLERRPVKKVLLLQITPDRGLAGGLPSNINRAVIRFMLAHEAPVSVITIGKKGRDFMARAGRDLHASFDGLSDAPSVAAILPITSLITRLYTSGDVDEVHIAYTRFVNTIVQEPAIMQLLPITAGDLEEPGAPADYEYEPNVDEVLNILLPRFVDMQVYQAVLESNASEQSARMVAMRNATEAAEEMIDSLTLELNKARQAMITAELLDIVGGVAALEG